jgi:hypothetical protein
LCILNKWLLDMGSLGQLWPPKILFCNLDKSPKEKGDTDKCLIVTINK